MTINLDENALFKAAMGDVKPLKACDTRFQPAPKPSVSPRDRWQEALLDNPLTAGMLDIVPGTVPLEYRADGIQQGVLDKLRLGKYAPEAELDLRQQPVARCRELLYLFILQAQHNNLRNLLIVHGKARRDDSHANIIRSYLNRWLQQFDAVQAFCIACPMHGGSGACYVGLKKSEQARLENGERHARRGR